jgi:hypothetical protein
MSCSVSVTSKDATSTRAALYSRSGAVKAGCWSCWQLGEGERGGAGGGWAPQEELEQPQHQSLQVLHQKLR